MRHLIVPEFIPIVKALAAGRKLTLALFMLACLGRSLYHMLQEPFNRSAGPLWMLQLWIYAYFPDIALAHSLNADATSYGLRYHAIQVSSLSFDDYFNHFWTRTTKEFVIPFMARDYVPNWFHAPYDPENPGQVEIWASYLIDCADVQELMLETHRRFSNFKPAGICCNQPGYSPSACSWRNLFFMNRFNYLKEEILSRIWPPAELLVTRFIATLEALKLNARGPYAVRRTKHPSPMKLVSSSVERSAFPREFQVLSQLKDFLDGTPKATDMIRPTDDTIDVAKETIKEFLFRHFFTDEVPNHMDIMNAAYTLSFADSLSKEQKEFWKHFEMEFLGLSSSYEAGFSTLNEAEKTMETRDSEAD
ncbi:hypothetical protein CRG98_042661 [Punica granatum]|uniref:Aminotransferase-like plant mobile domain-containing protein n=1 Tax=Punica granatum TaxID=22663 RepID=A0A2I0HZN6_PUNGR|nr:hypothetical protein CRG98_042661 [Punica granatum]